MYMVLVYGELKPGKKDEFVEAWSSQLLPLLKEQDGFVDAVLGFEQGSQKPCGVGFWKTREHAERWQHEMRSQAGNIMRDLTIGEPKVRGFELAVAEMFKIKANKAA